MNKYGLTAEILKKQRIAVNETDEVFNDGVAKAVDAVDDFWEARKVTVTRKEAEWLDRLMENFELPEALYYVERCGRGYAFEYTLENGTYVLSSNRDSLDEEKNRLWNAVIYGYEVEKEKLYTVEIPNPNDSVHTILHRTEKGIIISYSTDENYKNIKQNQLTEAEIKQDFEWAWQFAKEVEE